MKQFDLKTIIKTERCIIKMPELEDAQSIYDMIDDDIIKYMAWSKTTVEDTEKNLMKCREEAELGKSWEAAIYLKNGECIGRFGIHAINSINKSTSFGYWIGKAYWGKGYIPECVDAFKKEYFEMFGGNKLSICCNKGNINSEKVAQKCGFQYEGIMRADAFEKGEFVDRVYYSFLKSDYERESNRLL